MALAVRTATAVSLPLARERVTSIAIGATVFATVLWIWSIPKIDLARVSGTGLITAMPTEFFVACSALALGFALAMRSRRLPRRLLAVQLMLAGVLLHVTAIIAQPLARFPTSWTHSGYADYIARTGRTLPGFDARFSWPGFFSAAGMITRAAGLDNPVPLLRFAPVFFVGMGAVGVFAIAGAVTRGPLVPYIATWLFLTADWIGQDYFAPQALAFVLELALVVVLLRYFWQHPTTTTTTRWSIFRHPFLWLHQVLPDEPHDTVPEFEQRSLRMLLVALFGVMVMSHQLTPGMAVATVCALVLARRTTLRRLPLVMFAIFLAWLSYGAIGYWSGHADQLFAGLGQTQATFGQNVSNRLAGDPSRIAVQYRRMGLTVAVGGLAALGFVRRVRAGFGDLSLVILGLAPFGVLAGQSYGGEGLLRCVFFSLPCLAVFTAMCFGGMNSRLTRFAGVSLWVVLSLLAPLFIAARFGNEAWDAQTPSEHAALDFIYATKHPGAIKSLVSEFPGGYLALDSFPVLPSDAPKTLVTAKDVEDSLANAPFDVYVVVTRGQVEFGKLFGGYPPTWAAEVVDDLIASGSYRLIFTNVDSVVLFRDRGTP
jgi:hypothetical protein